MRWPGRHGRDGEDADADAVAGQPEGSYDRVLATARVRDGGDAIGSVDGLRFTDESQPSSGHAPGSVWLPWGRIDTASWDTDENVLTVRVFALDDEPGRSYALPLTDPGRLPELVRERVTASILVDTRVDVGGGRGARVIARRQRGANDPEWLVVYDEGVDDADTAVAGRVREHIDELRASLGI